MAVYVTLDVTFIVLLAPPLDQYPLMHIELAEALLMFAWYGLLALGPYIAPPDIAKYKFGVCELDLPPIALPAGGSEIRIQG